MPRIPEELRGQWVESRTYGGFDHVHCSRCSADRAIDTGDCRLWTGEAGIYCGECGAENVNGDRANYYQLTDTDREMILCALADYQAINPWDGESAENLGRRLKVK